MTATITAKQVDYIKDLAKQAGYQTPGAAAGNYGISVKADIARELSTHEASRLIDALTAELDETDPLDELDDDTLIAALVARGYTVTS